MNAVDELNFLLGIGPPRPQLPLTLQRSGYASVRALGKGSFGQAFLVFHKARGQYYVVKHVNMTNMTSRQRKDAHNEISVLQQLHHPNIVRYVECFEEHPHLYIVMEYADGGDLYTHLQKISRLAGPSLLRQGLGGGHRGDAKSAGLLAEPQVISLFVQTTMAVKYMHDRHLLHRDIKSQNVFLTRNHVVKLGDFGITTVLQNTVAMASTMCGTPCYFSPELCKGQPYNNKSDVWALGVLLYELCAGTLPFESTTMKALMKEIVDKQPRRIPPCFSDELWKLVQWMLEKNPKKRPDAGQVLLQPVLMRRVPDIIAQLQSAQATDISPRAGAKPATGLGKEGQHPSGQVDGEGNATRTNTDRATSPSGQENLCAVNTEPYQQLLAQQGKENTGGAHHPTENKAGGKNPFAGALPAGNTGGGYASGLGVRPSAELTPGQKAAQDVLLYKAKQQQQQHQQQRRQGGGGGLAINAHAPPTSSAANNNSNHKAATNHQAGGSKRPISELLAQFDAEKRRITESKNPPAPAPSSSALGKGNRDERKELNAPPKLPPQLSHAAAVSEARSQLAAAGAAAGKRSTDDSRSGKGGEGELGSDNDHTGESATAVSPGRPQREKNERELGEMLKEMTGHFALFASTRVAKEGEAIPVPTPSPPPAPLPNPPPRRTSIPLPHDHDIHGKNAAKKDAIDNAQGKEGEPTAESVPVATSPTAAAHEFSDPSGAKLDVAALQDEAALAHASSRKHAGNANADKLFSTSFNKRFDGGVKASISAAAAAGRDEATGVKAGNGGVASKPTTCDSAAGTAAAAAAAAAAHVVATAKIPPTASREMAAGGEQGVDNGERFFGACPCGANAVAESLSLIYGSFLCSCEVCCRYVSCGSPGGVEWLHLPNVTVFAEVQCHVPHGNGSGSGENESRAPSPQRTPTHKEGPSACAAGAGATAATALKATPTDGSNAHAHTFTIAVEDGDEDGDGDMSGKPREATFVKHFCRHCGTTLAFEHADVDGLLLPKAVLSEESLAVLDRFATSVVLDS